MLEAVHVLGLRCEAGEQKSQAPPGLGSGEGRGKGCVFPQVDVVSRSGEKIPVSVWMKKVKQDHSQCCVVVLEPVERVSAWVAFQSDVSVPSASQPCAAYYVCAASPGLSPHCGLLCAPGVHGRSAPAAPLICGPQGGLGLLVCRMGMYLGPLLRLSQPVSEVARAEPSEWWPARSART